MSTSAVIDWDSPTWGQPGHNVHKATSGNYGPDKGHDDVTEDQ